MDIQIFFTSLLNEVGGGLVPANLTAFFPEILADVGIYS